MVILLDQLSTKMSFVLLFNFMFAPNCQIASNADL